MHGCVHAVNITSDLQEGSTRRCGLFTTVTVAACIVSSLCKITERLPYCLFWRTQPTRNRALGEDRESGEKEIKRTMASKTLLSSAAVQLVIISLLCDASPASAAAAAVPATSRQRRQIPEDQPPMNEVQPSDSARSLLLRAWLDARRPAFDEDSDVEDELKRWLKVSDTAPRQLRKRTSINRQ